jgi:hypothetical protein
LDAIDGTQKYVRDVFWIRKWAKEMIADPAKKLYALW